MAIAEALNKIFGSGTDARQSDVLNAIRSEYPVYSDVPDEALAKALSEKDPEKFSYLKTFKADEVVPPKFTPRNLRTPSFYENNPDLSIEDAKSDLNEFRSQFPIYKDVDDVKLATSLAEKFPATYGHVISMLNPQPKRQPQKPASMSDVGDVFSVGREAETPNVTAEGAARLGRDLVGGAAGLIPSSFQMIASGSDLISDNAVGRAARRAAIKTRKISDKIMPDNPSYVDEVIAGVGSSLPTMLPAFAAPKVLSVLPGIGRFMAMNPRLTRAAVGATLEAIPEAGGSAETVLAEKGENARKEAAQAAAKNFLANYFTIAITEYFGIFNDKIKNKALRFLTGVGLETNQEGLQVVTDFMARNKPVNWGQVAHTLGVAAPTAGILSGGVIALETHFQKSSVPQEVVNSIAQTNPALAEVVTGKQFPVSEQKLQEAVEAGLEAGELQLVEAPEETSKIESLAPTGPSQEVVADAQIEGIAAFTDAIEEATLEIEAEKALPPVEPMPLEESLEILSLGEATQEGGLKPIPRRALPAIREIASELRQREIETIKGGHDPIFDEAEAVRLKPNKDIKDEIRQMSRQFMPDKGKPGMAIDEFAASMVDQGILPEGSGANEVMERLNKWRDRPRIPHIDDFMDQAADIWRLQQKQKTRARRAALQVLKANKIEDRVAIELVDEIIADPEAFETGYERQFDKNKEAIRGVTMTNRTKAVIQLAEGATEFTGRHEAFHAVSNLLLSEAEQNIIARKYGEGGPGQEKAADAFASYQKGKSSGIRLIDRAFNKIKQFLERLGNWIKTSKFATAEDIFKRIDAGRTSRKQYSSESVKKFDKENPPVSDSPITAVRLDDGTILYDKEARIHADLINKGVDAATIKDGGFLVDGEYRTGGADTGRIARMAKAKKAVEAKRAQYSSKELFETEKQDIDQRLNRHLDTAKRAGLNPAQAMKYAKDKLVEEAKTAPKAEKPTQKEFGSGGVQGFGQGRKGEQEFKLQYKAAYHGSPHEFEEFSLHKIGTGQGAASYGWGLYFAGKKEVAEGYREQLAGELVTKNFRIGDFQAVRNEEYLDYSPKTHSTYDTSRAAMIENILIDQVGIDASYAIGGEKAVKEHILQMIDDQITNYDTEYPEGAVALRQWRKVVEKQGVKMEAEKPGRVYEVDIPDDDEYLDWDKTLSHQGEKVKEVINKIPEPIWNHMASVLEDLGLNPIEKNDPDYTGRDLYQALVKYAAEGPLPGDNPHTVRPEEAASRYLSRIGLPGLKYLDQGSRDKTARDLTYNYVVFDDKLVKIIHKYQYSSERLIPETDASKTLPQEYMKAATYKPSMKENFQKTVEDKRSAMTQFKDKILTVFSTRLANIDPSLKDAMRRFEFDYRRAIQADVKKAKPFLDGLGQMQKASEADYKMMDLAMKNGDLAVMGNLAAKHGIDLRPVQAMLEDLHKRIKSVGYEIGYLPGYFPRRVQDQKGFLRYMEKQGFWGEIEQAIKEKSEDLGRELTENERVNLINSFIRGFVRSKILLAKTGNMKTRMIDKLTPELSRYYYSSRDALLRYISDVNEAIEARKLFGRVEVKPDLPTWAQEELAAMPEEQRRQSALSFNNINDSIGAYINRLLEAGKISPSQQQELRDLFQARFGYIGSHGIVGLYKSITYMDTIANPISALTQLEDLGVSLYKSLWHTPGSFVRALADKSKITLKDLDLDAVSEEIHEISKSQAMLRSLLRASGFTFMDRVGKETFMNTVIDKYRAGIQSGDAELEQNIVKLFGGLSDQVIEDLKNGKTTENILFLAFNELSEVQPITLSEVPEQYLASPGGRLFYALKTFMVKRLDWLRNETTKGPTTLENLKRFTHLYAILIAFGAGVDELKDYVLGRKTDWSDRLIDNLLKPFGLSKFFLYRIREEGPVQALVDFLTPPHKLIDSIWKDIKYAGNPVKIGKRTEPRMLEISSSIPIGGKLWYWWAGRGAQKTRAKEAKIGTLQQQSIRAKKKAIRDKRK